MAEKIVVLEWRRYQEDGVDYGPQGRQGAPAPFSPLLEHLWSSNDDTPTWEPGQINRPAVR
jgi:hypothetical protein